MLRFAPPLSPAEPPVWSTGTGLGTSGPGVAWPDRDRRELLQVGAGVCPGSCLCAVAVAVEGLQMRSELKLQLRREEKFNGDSEFGGVPVRATWQRGVVAEVVPEPLVPVSDAVPSRLVPAGSGRPQGCWRPCCELHLLCHSARWERRVSFQPPNGWGQPAEGHPRQGGKRGESGGGFCR